MNKIKNSKLIKNRKLMKVNGGTVLNLGPGVLFKMDSGDIIDNTTNNINVKENKFSNIYIKK